MDFREESEIKCTARLTLSVTILQFSSDIRGVSDTTFPTITNYFINELQ